MLEPPHLNSQGCLDELQKREGFLGTIL
jgi:hypothetical protein